MTQKFSIHPATVDHIPLVLRFIKELAAYEKLSHEVTATEELLRRNLFSERKTAEVLLAREGEDDVGFGSSFTPFPRLSASREFISKMFSFDRSFAVVATARR